MGIVAGAIGWLVMHRYPDEQRLLVINNYADADCELAIVEHGTFRFALRQGRTYRRKIGAPSDGFVRILCETDKGWIQTPGDFHFEDGGLAEVTFEEWGEAKVRYIRREEFAASR